MSKREKPKTAVATKTEKPGILSAKTEKPISKVAKTAKPRNPTSPSIRHLLSVPITHLLKKVFFHMELISTELIFFYTKKEEVNNQIALPLFSVTMLPQQ